MRRYYKERFECCGLFEDYKSQIRTCSVSEFNQAISQFITNEFPYMSEYEEYWKYTKLHCTVKTLVLSDRYNKDEAISGGLDFDLVRRVLYSFNTRNLINFLSHDWNSLLFYHYFDERGVIDINNHTDVDPKLLYLEMQELYKESEKYLKITMDNYKRDLYDPSEQQMMIWDEDYMWGLMYDQ